MTTVKKEQKERNAIFVELGDAFAPPPRQAKLGPDKQKEYAAFIQKVMSETRYDAYVPGELDLGPGLDALIEFQKSSQIPFLAGNLVDPETGDPFFEKSRIVLRDGLRIALVGVVGPEAFAAAPANVDFNLKAYQAQRAVSQKGASRKMLKKVHESLKAAGVETESGDIQKEQLAQLVDALEGGGEASAAEGTRATPPSHTGPRFRITDPVEFAMRELAALKGKADIFVALGHMTRGEVSEFRKKATGYHFLIDGHGEGKSSFPRGQGTQPHILRSGNRGRSLVLATLHIVGDSYNFQDRSSRQRNILTLKRQEKLYEKLTRGTKDKDPATAGPGAERKRKRIERIRERIRGLKAKTQIDSTSSYYETREITLDDKIASDPDIARRMDELSPPASRKH